MADLAKNYSHQKYLVSIIETFYSIALLLVFLGSGLSLFLENTIKHFSLPGYLSVSVFLLVILFVYYLLSLPFNFYSGYILEHKFSLSKQKIGAW